VAEPPRTLQGKVVAVTGGARGIGRATADALARKGARVAIGDVDAAAAATAADEIGAHAYELDVTDTDSFEAFLDGVEADLGPLDVMINNAGILHLGPFVEEDEASQARQVDINLHGPMTGTKLALKRMLPRGRGHIVNVASSAGKFAPPGIATYTATKHGVVGFTEAMNRELHADGIKSCALCPGYVDTELSDFIKDRLPAEEMIQVSDIAEIVRALLKQSPGCVVPEVQFLRPGEAL
jgi:NAD(P)-dependent dehydrogenase (short-subunit alcohol dehydrogenase family)